MLYSGTYQKSYITEYTSVYEDKSATGGGTQPESCLSLFYPQGENDTSRGHSPWARRRATGAAPSPDLACLLFNFRAKMIPQGGGLLGRRSASGGGTQPDLACLRRQARPFSPVRQTAKMFFALKRFALEAKKISALRLKDENDTSGGRPFGP